MPKKQEDVVDKKTKTDKSEEKQRKKKAIKKKRVELGPRQKAHERASAPFSCPLANVTRIRDRVDKHHPLPSRDSTETTPRLTMSPRFAMALAWACHDFGKMVTREAAVRMRRQHRITLNCRHLITAARLNLAMDDAEAVIQAAKVAVQRYVESVKSEE